MTASAEPPDVAYYYPAPYWGWQEGGWVKSLLLFFDQIAILLPDYMHGRHVAADPVLAQPLEDAGLLSVLEPKAWLDQEMTNSLAEVMVELLTSGVFDDLPKDRYFHELSQSRMGYGADVGLAQMLVEELIARDLARPSENGVSVPLHPTVRTTILVLLAQLARRRGKRSDMLVHPATSYEEPVRDLIATLSRQGMASAGHVVALDLEPVGLDLDIVPLDDVLSFRAERLTEHKRYMRDLRRFLAELALAEEDERNPLVIERQEEIADAAHDLRKVARRAIGKNLAAWSLGIAGSVWAYTAHDPLGVALAALGLVPGFVPSGERASAYSYLFSARSAFGTYR